MSKIHIHVHTKDADPAEEEYRTRQDFRACGSNLTDVRKKLSSVQGSATKSSYKEAAKKAEELVERARLVLFNAV